MRDNEKPRERSEKQAQPLKQNGHATFYNITRVGSTALPEVSSVAKTGS